MAAADANRIDRGDLEVIDTIDGLDEAIGRLAAGEGPVAIDTERASGYRYSDRAYLVQIFRRGSGTMLLDPIPFGTLAPIAEVIADEEWILHAATQDIPCMREIDLHPKRLFDTELASRLLGKSHVGLGAVVEELLGIELAKAHSADDWSQRPLPESWLAYAALDVEHLVDVRDLLAAELLEANKAEWAAEEFDDILGRSFEQDRSERWRRLSGLHALRSPRQLAVARELWRARDAYAQETDIAPGRLVPDRALTAAARMLPRTKAQLAASKEFTGRASRSELDRWWAAIELGRETTDLPPRSLNDPDRLPPPKAWAAKNPAADARLKVARPAVAEIAETISMPTENLLTPSFLRRAAWEPAGLTTDALARQLRDLGARQWQTSLTAPVIATAFVEADQAVQDSLPSDG
ncbi:ribonuclease D [Gulosibacter macacae]|uniref:Ribonuclease D n=1 Tax=Gulosibacter macacae TaxID=2488791 RepID=A0A3P3W855_9MICO|nr:ribonuclease D [Gulosibacter macacae]RRJ88843.1 ribonuclease D [Gulosibacter macacae]